MVKKLFIINGLLIAAFLLSVVDVSAAKYEEEFVLRPDTVFQTGVSKLDLRFTIRNARVLITQSDDPDLVVRVLVKFDGDALLPVFSEGVLEGAYSVGISSSAEAAKGAETTLHDWEIQIGRYDLETDLTLDFAGVQADMDLGGMPLSGVVMGLKGTRTRLNFSGPTPNSVTSLNIICEGTFLQGANIGQTAFEAFQLSAAGSSLDLDFAGAYAPGDYSADFKLAGCSGNINLPISAGALVVHQPANRSVDLAGGGWSQEPVDSSDAYKTEDYEEMASRINLRVASNGTTIRVRREGTNLNYQLSY